MEKLLFTNLPKFNLQPADKIYVIDEKIGAVGIVRIKRKDESKYVSGIYSCKTGELLLSDAEYDEIYVDENGYGRDSKFYYKVVRDGKFGAISLEGVLALEPEYLDITDLVGGSMIVKIAPKKYAAYSVYGEELLPAKYIKMKREKSFIIATTSDNEVSIIHDGQVLVRDVKCKNVSHYWYYVVIHKENSFILCSIKGLIGEFEGSSRYRQGQCIEITNGKRKGLIDGIDGSIIIPMDEYRSIKKQYATYVAERMNGTTITGVSKSWWLRKSLGQR